MFVMWFKLCMTHDIQIILLNLKNEACKHIISSGHNIRHTSLRNHYMEYGTVESLFN